MEGVVACVAWVAGIFDGFLVLVLHNWLGGTWFVGLFFSMVIKTWLGHL